MTSCPCSGGGLVKALRHDVDRYLFQLDGEVSLTIRRVLRVLVLFPGIWAVVPYRLTHQCLYRFRPKLLADVPATFFFAVQRLMIILFGIEIDAHAHIGPGIFVNHSGGVVIGPATIGRNCNISHGVTLGRSSLAPGTGGDDAPILGDRVWLGPGAVVAGPIALGNDVVVAANSLVTRNIPDRGVGRGVPASVISLTGSFRQVSYAGMLDDPERAASMTAMSVAGVDDAFEDRGATAADQA
jgi:serine O-acetyltransferase